LVLGVAGLMIFGVLEDGMHENVALVFGVTL